MQQRALREEQVEAERILIATQSALDQDADLLSVQEREQIDDSKEKPPYSEGKTFTPQSFLWHLQQREYDVRNGR